MKKNKKPNDNNTTSNNLLKFPKKITNKNSKKFEPFNVVSETGDSIYPATQIEELEQEGGGQVYISLSEIRKIINEELDKRFGSSINNKNE